MSWPVVFSNVILFNTFYDHISHTQLLRLRNDDHFVALLPTSLKVHKGFTFFYNWNANKRHDLRCFCSRSLVVARVVTSGNSLNVVEQPCKKCELLVLLNEDKLRFIKKSGCSHFKTTQTRTMVHVIKFWFSFLLYIKRWSLPVSIAGLSCSKGE